MKKTLLFCLLTSSLSLLTFCAKEGPGGKATIKGRVMMNSTPVPGAVVYIKYGATQSPGSNITYYDASVNANSSAAFEFNDLKKGDYYLFAVGFDSTLVQTVTGGVAAKLSSKTAVITADVPVGP